MKKFVLCIDWKAETKKGLDYMSFEASDLEEAIDMADEMWNDKVYLMQIMKAEGKAERIDGYKVETYRASLCRRSYGWHRNTKENSEAEHVVERWTKKDIEFFQTK